jgi:hypothetical protein
MMRSAHNPHLVWCGASNQRVGAGGGGGGGAGGGAGNGDPPGGAAATPFGFFGLSILRSAFGGPAGRSSATTGLGSTAVEAGVEKSPGMRVTCTGTVTGWNLLSV